MQKLFLSLMLLSMALTKTGGATQGVINSGATNFNGKVTIKPLTALTNTGGTTKGIINRNTSQTRTPNNGPATVAFSPLSNYVAVTNQNNNNVEIFGVDGLGNISSTLSLHATGNAPTSVTWSPNWSVSTGGLIAVANNNDNTIQTFSVNPSGTVSSVLSSQTAGISPYAVAWSPNGGFLAAVNNNNRNTVETLSVDLSGNLSPAGSASTDVSPLSVAWSPNWSNTTGGFIVIANSAGNSLQSFSVDTSGNLLLVSDVATASVPSSVAISPHGNFVAVANQNGNNIQTFSLDASGHLSSAAISSQLVGPAPIALIWSPTWSNTTGGSLAVISSYANMIQIFDVNTSGNISSLQVGYANTGSYPYSLSWSPSGSYIAVTNTGSNNVQIFNSATI